MVVGVNPAGESTMPDADTSDAHKQNIGLQPTSLLGFNERGITKNGRETILRRGLKKKESVKYIILNLKGNTGRIIMLNLRSIAPQKNVSAPSG